MTTPITLDLTDFDNHHIARMTATAKTIAAELAQLGIDACRLYDWLGCRADEAYAGYQNALRFRSGVSTTDKNAFRATWTKRRQERAVIYNYAMGKIQVNPG